MLKHFYSVSAGIFSAASLSFFLLTIGATVATSNGWDVGPWSLFSLPLPFGFLMGFACLAARFEVPAE